MFKLVVAGSRSFQNFKEADKILMSVLRNRFSEGVTIVSGGARGADTIGEMFALKHKLEIERYIPDWDKYGKAAGFRRNKQMAENSNATILFWDGESKGTLDMHSRTLEFNNPLIVVYFNPKTQEIIEIKNESNPF